MTGWREMAGAAVLALVAGVALAEEQRVGAIAFAQAVEQGGGVGTGATAEAAIAAARAACVAGGARAEDCLITAACEPAQWSVDIFVQHQEGPHWHEMLCGIADEAMITGVVEAVCDRAARPWIMECALVEVRDPSGRVRPAG
jgi:hypothetical protein